MSLRIEGCSYQAAKFAVMNWHYSHVMPSGKLIKYGVWEDNRFIGCIIFGRGANNHIGQPYKLAVTEVCELVRIALSSHQNPVSRIVGISIRLLRANNPALRLIVSYADPAQGHVGSIYQAMNWIYVGKSQAQREMMINGRIVHKRAVNSIRGTVVGLPYSDLLWKHKYLYPLDRAMRKQISILAQPYPKLVQSNLRTPDGSTPVTMQGGGGSTPTRPLMEGQDE